MVGLQQFKETVRDPLSDAFGGAPGSGDRLMGMLKQLFGPVLDELNRRAAVAQRTGRDLNIFGMIQDLDHRVQRGGLGLQQMKDAALRDATVFYQLYGCQSPQSLHFGEQLAEFARQWNRNL
jgi:hypothetical protein